MHFFLLLYTKVTFKKKNLVFLPYNASVQSSVVLDLTVLHCVDKTSSSKYLLLFSAEESHTGLELHEGE